MTPAMSPGNSNRATSLHLANLRRHGRVVISRVRTDLGEILDVSASGARVRRRGGAPEIGSEFDCEISSSSGPIRVRSRAIWVHRVGIDEHDVGLEFLELTPTARAALIEIVHESIARSRAADDSTRASTPSPETRAPGQPDTQPDSQRDRQSAQEPDRRPDTEAA